MIVEETILHQTKRAFQSDPEMYQNELIEIIEED
jgi:hypothetical protein